jgi:aquaporin Z
MSTAAVQQKSREPRSLADALTSHWPEYLMEAGELGSFMISACVVTVLLEHPSSWLYETIENPILRRGVAGLAMGLTAVAIILSPWGKRSGAHMNPAVTLTFCSLGKVAWRDAVFYVLAQFIGGIAGVAVASVLVGPPLRHSAVNYAVTVPGAMGVSRAFIAEAVISALLMMIVLVVSNRRRIAPYLPFTVGLLIAAYITIEAPLSGMSMNAARTFGSALAAGDCRALWLYFAGPLLGMLAAGQLYRAFYGTRAVFCAKFHHHNQYRCIFRCRFGQM